MNRFFLKTLLFTGTLFTLLSFLSASSLTYAQNSQSIEMPSDIDAEAVDRYTRSNTIRFITNSDESVNLVVAETGIAIQFSDEFLDNLDNEIRNSDEEIGEGSAFAGLIRDVVGSSVRKILDHAILIPFYEISSVTYEDGRIHMTDVNGEDIFDDLEINDRQIMEDFSRRDSQRFVADAEKRLI